MRKSGLLKNLCLVCSCLGLGIFNSALALDSPPLITRQPTLELKPIPSEAFQLAKATFLPDYAEGPFSGYSSPIDYNPKGDCDNISSLYTTKNCTYPKAVVSSSSCPFKPGYYKECKCLPQFKLTSCKSPYILGGDSCEGKYEKCVCPSSVSLYYPNDYCTQYCEGKCIAKSCSRTPNETGCQYGTGSTSDGCGGTRVYCKANPCLSVSCGSNAYCSGGSCYCNSGYEGNAYSGCTKKPTCTADSCSGYTLSSCPSGSTCSSCTIKYSDCSSGGTKYKVTNTHTHSYSCPSGYQSSSCSSTQTQVSTTSKVCSCGATSGTCYKCQDKGKTCTAVTCSNYTLSSKSDSNANYDSCTKKNTDCSSGATVYKKTGCKSGYTLSGGSCVADCVSGGSSSCSGQTSACSSSQVQTSSCKDCSGTTHYSCRAKTCSEQGKKDCNGSCISKSECCSPAPANRPYCINGDWNECSQEDYNKADSDAKRCPASHPYAVKCLFKDYQCAAWCCKESNLQCGEVKYKDCMLF